MRSTWIAIVAGALGLTGCTPAYVREGEADVFLYVTVVNDGQALSSDVREGGTAVEADVVDVGLANRSKNPNLPTAAVTRAIQLQRYTVRYYRSDGRNTEGVDVPYSISGDLRNALDLDENLTVRLQVVRAQAKLDPPLTNLKGVATGTLGGSSLILTCFAEITIYGATTTGKTVSASGSMQIDFADFP